MEDFKKDTFWTNEYRYEIMNTLDVQYHYSILKSDDVTIRKEALSHIKEILISVYNFCESYYESVGVFIDNNNKLIKYDDFSYIGLKYLNTDQDFLYDDSTDMFTIYVSSYGQPFKLSIYNIKYIVNQILESLYDSINREITYHNFEIRQLNEDIDKFNKRLNKVYNRKLKLEQSKASLIELRK